MEKTTKKRVKHAILGVTSVALVAGVTSALTMAMLSDMESAENTFTANPSLSAALYEPKWDGENIPADKGITVDGTQSYTGGAIGKNVAKSYVPGTPIDKNPFVANDSDSDEYVALRVTYQVKCNNNGLDVDAGVGGHCPAYGNWHTISPTDFKTYFAKTSIGTTDVADPNTLSADEKNISTSVKSNGEYDTSHFILEEGQWCDYYYYGTKNGGGEGVDTLTVLNSDHATPNLFSKVIPLESLDKLDEDVSGNRHMFKVTGCDGCDDGNADYQTPLHDMTGTNEVVIATGNSDGLPEFRIVVVASAVQTKNVGTVDKIKEELKECFPAITNLDDLGVSD